MRQANIGSTGSNEDYWRKYQQEPEKGLKKSMLKNGVGLMPGIDPEESFNAVKGILLVWMCTVAVAGLIIWLVS